VELPGDRIDYTSIRVGSKMIENKMNEKENITDIVDIFNNWNEDNNDRKNTNDESENESEEKRFERKKKNDEGNGEDAFYETWDIPEKKVREYYFQQYRKYFFRPFHINER
jgi:hypothetical protein